MSLKKIAEMTGVSPSTVSRVLNDRTGSCASEAVKQKIWEAAHKIHYIPNQAARDLKQKKTAGERPAKSDQIILIMARKDALENDPFFKELYRDLQIELFRNGCTIADVLSADEAILSDDFDCDGIIVVGRCPKKLLSRLTARTRNLVGIWRNPMQYEIDEVVCDGREAAHMAVSFLIDHGHRRIGYIGDCSYESRYVGYTEMMIQNHLPLDYDTVIPTDQTEAAGYQAMQQMLLIPDLTAVLCANDISAVGALRALREWSAEQTSSARRISVISIDNIEEAQYTAPLLTTVRIPRRDMSHMAVLLLKDRIRHGHTEKTRVSFPCTIAERDSVYSINA